MAQMLHISKNEKRQTFTTSNYHQHDCSMSDFTSSTPIVVWKNVTYMYTYRTRQRKKVHFVHLLSPTAWITRHHGNFTPCFWYQCTPFILPSCSASWLSFVVAPVWYKNQHRHMLSIDSLDAAIFRRTPPRHSCCLAILCVYTITNF